MYKQCINPLTNELANCVIRLSDKACIPFSDGNSDYQEYLKFLENGGIPLPAENT